MKPCSICNHQRRSDIETAILNGTPYRQIKEWYDVSTSAIARHKQDHINTQLIRSLPPVVIAENVSLTDQLRDIHARTLSILMGAEASGDGRTALIAIRECRSNLELLAKIEFILATQAAAKQENEPRTIVFYTKEEYDAKYPGSNPTLMMPDNGRDSRSQNEDIATQENQIIEPLPVEAPESPKDDTTGINREQSLDNSDVKPIYPTSPTPRPIMWRKGVFNNHQ